jgi:archaellin
MIKIYTNNTGGTTLSTTILLIAFILIAVTAASILTGQSGNTINQEDFKQIVEDVLDEVTTYIQIKDTMGKYDTSYGEQRIEKITLLVKPLFPQNVDISELTVKLCNGNQVKILHYSGNTELIGSQTLFEHIIWDTITENTFGFIAILDTDRSLVDYDVLNKDMAYIIIKLGDFAMVKGETMTITLFPSSGIERTIVVTAPLPIKPVVSFE